MTDDRKRIEEIRKEHGNEHAIESLLAQLDKRDKRDEALRIIAHGKDGDWVPPIGIAREALGEE